MAVCNGCADLNNPHIASAFLHNMTSNKARPAIANSSTLPRDRYADSGYWRAPSAATQRCRRSRTALVVDNTFCGEYTTVIENLVVLCLSHQS